MRIRRELIIGIVTLIPGLTVTFLADHSLRTGLIVFAGWTGLMGLAELSAPLTDHQRRRMVRALLALAVAALAIASLLLGHAALFPILLGVAALIWAALELTRFGAGDRLSAVCLLALGLAELLMPVNPVVNVGLFGATLVVLGVWQIIGALSPTGTVEPEGESTHHA